MSPIVVIAALTIREALRRRIVAVSIAISAGLVGLSAWGFYRLSHSHSVTPGEVQVSLPQSLILFMFMFSFVVALSASAFASPAISSDAESGVLQTIVTRAIRRSEVLLGKWTGLAVILAGYSIVVSGLEFGAVDWVSGFVPPNPVAVALYLFAEGVIVLTLAMLLSTRLSSVAAGVVAIALFGGGWLAGVVGSLGTTYNIGALRTVGQVAKYVLPTDGLWHGAIYYLQPQSTVGQGLFDLPGLHSNVFFSQASPTSAYLVWVGVWFLAVLIAALVSFERQDL